jgi:hypothetical protein
MLLTPAVGLLLLQISVACINQNRRISDLGESPKMPLLYKTR